jgi:nucleoside-diphosphate-sugar epimerase
VKPWIVVTGSSGLIGGELVKRLSETYDVAALDVAPPHIRNANGNVFYFEVDLGDPQAIRMFFQTNNRPILGLVNLAAYYNFLNRPSLHSERLKRGLPELAAAYKAHRLSQSCFIQASSMACLEPVENGVLIGADAESLPRWEYPRFKKESEDILRSELSAENYVEMVLAGVYTEFCELVPLHQFIESHLRNKIQRFFYPGDGNQGLTYVHLSDVCEAIERQLKARVVRRRLLLGESQPTTYRQIAKIVDRQIYGFVIPKIRVPKWFARFGASLLSKIFKREFYQPWMIGFAQEHYQFDLQALFEQLNWTPRRRLCDDLPLIIRNAREHAQEWRELNSRRPWHVDDWPQLDRLVRQTLPENNNETN